MDTKLMNYKIGVFYRKTNPWWNIDYLKLILNKYKSLAVEIIEVSNFDKNKIPTDLDIIAILPHESDYLPELINRNKNLKWVHCLWAGVDKFLNKKEISENDKIILTNARGAYAESLAEFAIFAMLYFYFNTPTYLKGFQERKWTVPTNKLLKDKTLGVVGYGLNGIEIAKKAKLGFEMKVIGIRKDGNDATGKEYVDNILPVEKLDELLPQVDFLISVLPHTNETIDLYNYSKFKMMKPTSIFINLGRGSAVVEEDLVKVLKEKIITGAVLDVFKTEPLPSDSPLFDLDNIFLSFHSCDNTDEYFKQGVDVLVKNINAFLKDGKPLTIVDKKLGF